MRKRQAFQLSSVERLEDRVVLRGGANVGPSAVAALINQAYTAFELKVQQDIINFTNDLDGASNNGGVPVVQANPALQQFLPSGNPNPKFNPNANPFVFANTVKPQQAFINYFTALQGQINTLAAQLSSGLNRIGVNSAAHRAQLKAAIAAQVTGAPTNGTDFNTLPAVGSLSRTLLSTGPLDAKAAQPTIVQFQDLSKVNSPAPGTIVPNKSATLVNLVGQSSFNAIEQSRVALTIQATAISKITGKLHHR